DDSIDFRMACAFCYYGVVFMSTEILLQEYTEEAALLSAQIRNGTESAAEISDLIARSNLTMMSFNNGTDIEPCPMLRQSDYVKLLWTTLAEFPGSDQKKTEIMTNTNFRSP